MFLNIVATIIINTCFTHLCIDFSIYLIIITYIITLLYYIILFILFISYYYLYQLSYI